MAKKNLWKLVLRQKKWLAIYIATMIVFVLLLAASIIFLDNGIFKAIVLTYEICVILAGIALLMVSMEKHSKK